MRQLGGAFGIAIAGAAGAACAALAVAGIATAAAALELISTAANGAAAGATFGDKFSVMVRTDPV
jgi:hypothetical protein